MWKLAGLCDVAGGLYGVVYSNSDSVCVDSVVHVSSVFCCLCGDFIVLLKGILWTDTMMLMFVILGNLFL